MQGQYSVAETYDRFAPIYDEFNASNNYELWLGELLLPELKNYGLRRGRALDVGCGTGRAFEPLLRRGWHVIGVDPSINMIRLAIAKHADALADGRLEILGDDLRELRGWADPKDREPVDLILCLNDVVPCLVDDGDLDRGFANMKRNLAPHGLICFDTNTLSLFRSHFASGNAEDMSVGDWEWRGLSPEAVPGGVHEARVSGPGVETHIHRERHWTSDQVQEALQRCGLRALAIEGQREDESNTLLDDPFDEERDQKLIWIVSHAP